MSKAKSNKPKEGDGFHSGRKIPEPEKVHTAVEVKGEAKKAARKQCGLNMPKDRQ